MPTRDLSAAAPGRYVPYGQRSYYRPDPLPPEGLELDGELRERLQNAVYQLGRLDGLGSDTDVSPMLYTTLTRREAVESVVIEGADVELLDVLESEQIGDGETVETDVQEALNYETAIRRGTEAVAAGEPITVSLLQELHATLLDGARGDTETLGAFRRKPVHIPPPRPDLRPFVPPAPEVLDELMTDLESFVAGPPTYHPLVDAALTHYQFETIHPFEDGNGRLGRILITLQLVQSGLLSDPFLYPSAYFNDHKLEYVQLMRGVSEDGAWLPWIRFFVRGIEEQAVEAVSRTEQLDALRQRYERTYGHGRTAADRLAVRLFERPCLTATDASELLDVSTQTARTAIDELIDDGVLEEVTGKQRYREYVARDILGVLDPTE